MRVTTIGGPNAFASKLCFAYVALMVEGLNARDQIAFGEFHSFLEEVQTNAGYIHATHA